MEVQASDLIDKDWEAQPEETEGSDVDGEGRGTDPDVHMELGDPQANIHPQLPSAAQVPPSAQTMSEWQSVYGVLAHKIAENTPDPFAHEDPEQLPHPSCSPP